MLKILDYKNLETRVHKGINAKIIFKPEDEIRLRVGIQEGKPIVEVVMPWGTIYNLGKYETEELAREAFLKYDSDLKKGYSLKISGHYSAEISK